MDDEKIDANAGNTPPQEPAQAAPQPVVGAAPVSELPAPLQPVPETPPKTPDSAPTLQNDIEKILSGVKLPERRDVPGVSREAPAPQKQYDTTLGSMLSEGDEEKVPATESKKPKAEAQEGSVVPVHTLKHDLQHVVRDQKISVVKAIALEQEKHRPTLSDEIPQPPPKTHRVLNILFASLLLIVLGALALGGVYYIAKQQVGTTPIETASDSLVFAEKTLAYPLQSESAQTIKNTLAERRLVSGTLGSMVRVVPIVQTQGDAGPIEREASFAEFIRAIGAQPPESLMRALSGQFFFGYHTVDENAPLIVVSVSSYDNAFAGMLEWEKTINADLAPIFTLVPRLRTGDDGIPTERTFADRIFRNYDVRALSDDSGTIQLYYAFPTRDILVIAESPYTFTEILSRLQAARRI